MAKMDDSEVASTMVHELSHHFYHQGMYGLDESLEDNFVLNEFYAWHFGALVSLANGKTIKELEPMMKAAAKLDEKTGFPTKKQLKEFCEAAAEKDYSKHYSSTEWWQESMKELKELKYM